MPRGHYGDYGMPDNYRALSGFRQPEEPLDGLGHVPGSDGTPPSAHASHHPSLVGANGVTRVTRGKSRVRESRPPGSVKAQAEWLSYSTTTHPMPTDVPSPCRCASLLAPMA